MKSLPFTLEYAHVAYIYKNTPTPGVSNVLSRMLTFRLCLLVVLYIRPAGQIFLVSISSLTDDGDLYEALAQMLSKKHVTNTELDLEAISHGDFRDVPQGAHV